MIKESVKMMIPIQFSGLYIKLADNTPPGPVGHTRTQVQVAVTNDEQGQHLDKYASIVGKDSRGNNFDDSSLSDEQLFQVDAGGNGYFPHNNFRAGNTEIDKTDLGKKALIIELIGELTNLYPPIKESLLRYTESYFEK